MDNITEYYSPNQLEAYAYRKSRIVDHTLDDANLETRCPLDNGRHLLPPQHSLGQLDVLPLELLECIFLTLDLPSLTVFRRVNRGAMGLVDSLHEYQMVLKHCPNVLRAIISIDARYFDCNTLYKTLTSAKCEACHRFGGYLYLITCKRICYFCLAFHPDYFPVLIIRTTRPLDLSRQEIEHPPHIFSLPGKYTPFGKLSKKRITLLDRKTALKMAIDDGIRQDLAIRSPRRYMSIISAPFLGSSGLSADWGFYCARCKKSRELGTSTRDKYTANGIVEHILRHEPVTVVGQQTQHV